MCPIENRVCYMQCNILIPCVVFTHSTNLQYLEVSFVQYVYTSIEKNWFSELYNFDIKKVKEMIFSFNF